MGTILLSTTQFLRDSFTIMHLLLRPTEMSSSLSQGTCLPKLHPLLALLIMITLLICSILLRHLHLIRFLQTANNTPKKILLTEESLRAISLNYFNSKRYTYDSKKK